jgi:predicted RND superfamily exporter protein
MKTNVGKTDKLVRIVLGIVIIALGLIYESWWGLIGLIPLITGIAGRCGLYIPFGISTCKTESATEAKD